MVSLQGRIHLPKHQAQAMESISQNIQRWKNTLQLCLSIFLEKHKFFLDLPASMDSLKSGYGVKSSKDLKAMESAQPLSDHRLAIDAVIAIPFQSVGVELDFFAGAF